MARLYLTRHPSPRSSCPSITNQTAQPAPSKSREGARKPHGYPAVSPDISGQGRSPSLHAGPSQPRRHCALFSTTKPAPGPPTCGCSTGPRTSRPHAVPPRPEPSARSSRHTAHSRTEHRSSPRAPQAQDKAPRQEGSSRPVIRTGPGVPPGFGLQPLGTARPKPAINFRSPRAIAHRAFTTTKNQNNFAAARLTSST